MILLLNALFVVVVDQLSKVFVRYAFVEGESIPIIKGVFHLTYVRNSGAAFGLFPGHHLIFLVLSVGVILLISLCWRRLRTKGRRMQLALSLELGGVAGNLIDRISTGKVTDFLDFRFWPVFNFADVAIVAGLFLILVTLLKSQWERSKV